MSSNIGTGDPNLRLSLLLKFLRSFCFSCSIFSFANYDKLVRAFISGSMPLGGASLMRPVSPSNSLFISGEEMFREGEAVGLKVC